MTRKSSLYIRKANIWRRDINLLLKSYWEKNHNGSEKINSETGPIPARRGSDQLRSVPVRLGPAQPHSAGFGSAARGPVELGSSWAGSAWFREGLAQLTEFASAQARPGPAGPGQGVPRPGLAAKVVALCKRLSQNHGVTGAKNNQIYGGEKIPQNDWPDPGSARIRPAPFQLRSARASRARLGSAWLTLAWACPTRPWPTRLGFGTVWLGSARLGCSPPRQPIFFGQPTEETG